MKMKKLLYILSALLILAGCGKDKGAKELSLKEQLCGEWHSIRLAVDDADVYLNFIEGGTFEMYQQIGEGAYRLYRGTWGLDGNTLTGKYNDGEDWAAGYDITVSDKTLTLTSKNDAAEDSQFSRAAIPAEVKDRCVPVVRAAGSSENLLL